MAAGLVHFLKQSNDVFIPVSEMQSGGIGICMPGIWQCGKLAM